MDEKGKYRFSLFSALYVGDISFANFCVCEFPLIYSSTVNAYQKLKKIKPNNPFD